MRFPAHMARQDDGGGDVEKATELRRPMSSCLKIISEFRIDVAILCHLA
jgi:hypothetical protein